MHVSHQCNEMIMNELYLWDKLQTLLLLQLQAELLFIVQ